MTYFFFLKRKFKKLEDPSGSSRNANSDNSLGEIEYEYEIEGEKIFTIQPHVPSETIKFVESYDKTLDKYDLRSSFDAIFMQLPALGANLSNVKNIVVSFPPEILKGITAGTYKLMENKQTGIIKAVAVDIASGKIVKIGEIVSKINPVNAITIIWQLAAIITAQKFLSDIDEKLKNIDESLNEIKNFLENSQISKITGSLVYLKSISNIIQNKALKENEIQTYHAILEQIELDCVRAYELFLPLIITKLQEYDSIVQRNIGGSWFGSKLKSSYYEITKNIDLIERYLNYQLIIQYVRLCNAKMKSSLPIDHQIISGTIMSVDEKLIQILNFRNSFTLKTEENIPLVRGILSRERTNDKWQKQIKDFLTETNNDLQIKEKEIMNLSEKLKQQLESVKNQVYEDEKYYFELNDSGGISTIRKIMCD
jgi:hypothetical protein